jgi:hypothetical protein
MEGKIEGKYRVRSIKEFKEGMKLPYILDSRRVFEDPEISVPLISEPFL